MTSFASRVFALALVVLTVHGAAPGRAAAAEGASSLDLYFHADLEGELATPACAPPSPSSAVTSSVPSPPDFAGLVEALESAREAAPERPSLVLLGPNAVAPDLFLRRLFRRDPTAAGRALAALFKRAHYAAFAVGSHELGWDPVWLESYLVGMKGAGLAMAPANVVCNDEARKARPMLCELATAPPVLLDVAGVGKVALFEAISPRLWAGLPPDHRLGLSVSESSAFLQSASVRARAAGADVVVAMVDVPTGRDGLDELRDWQADLDSGERPDILLAAGLADDEGARAVRLLRQDGTPAVVGSTTGTRGWTHVTLQGLTSRAPTSTSTDAPAPAPTPAPASAAARTSPLPKVLVETLHVSGTTTGPRTEDVGATLGAWIDDYCKVYGRPLGTFVRAPLGYEDFVTYVLELMRRRAGAEIALLNRRFVKSARFPWRGALTEGDLAQALPYPAALGVVILTGAQVQSLLGPARSKPKLAAVGIPHDGPMKVNGRDVDATRFYRVATIGFVAQGGDGLFEPGALPWKPLVGAPDVSALVHDFLVDPSAQQDGDPSISLATDFGPPPSTRPLIVTLTDLDLGLSNTSIGNGANYTDAQLTRAEQRAFKGDWNSVLTFRALEEDMDGRFRLQYGWTRTQPAGKAAVSGESLDLITGSWTYNDRRLRKIWHPPAWATPDPYARLFLESEFTRPAVTATQLRTYHHAELTATLGASFKPLAKLRVRVGPGARRELVAPGPAGSWRFALEGGLTLEPLALATVGALPVRLEGTLDYFLLEPTGTRSQQLRSSARLSFPLLPRLFLAVGVDVYGAQYASGPWQIATDSTASLRVHWDRAFQSF